jgi:hypothetical protein
MAFQYLSSSLDLFNLIFNQILKISPTLLSNKTLQEQVFQLILLPHVVLFLFLFSFGWGIIPENKGLRYLVMIISYIYIVMQGWYGSLVVPISLIWFPFLLIGGIILFFLFRVIHPITAQKLGEAGAMVAKDVGKRMGKDKQIEKLAEELSSVQRRMAEQRPHIENNPGAAQVYAQLEQREFALKRKIKQLEG